MFRDDRLARDIPAGLYIGHVQVGSAYARVTHEEHGRSRCRAEPIASADSASSGRGMRASLPTEDKALTSEQTAATRLSIARGGPRSGDRPRRPIAAPPRRACGLPIMPRDSSRRRAWCGVDSPVALSHLAHRASRADGPNVKSALIHRLRRQAASRVGSRVRWRVRAEVESVVNPADALVAAAAESGARAATCRTTRRCWTRTAGRSRCRWS